MKKVFVCCPMYKRLPGEIEKTVTKMKKLAEAYMGEELELLDGTASRLNQAQTENGIICNNYAQLLMNVLLLQKADVFVFVSNAFEFKYYGAEGEIVDNYFKDKPIYYVNPKDVMDDYEEPKRNPWLASCLV